MVLARGRESLPVVALAQWLVVASSFAGDAGIAIHLALWSHASVFVLIPWDGRRGAGLWGDRDPGDDLGAFAILLVCQLAIVALPSVRGMRAPSRGLTWQRADDPRDAGPRSHGAVSPDSSHRRCRTFLFNWLSLADWAASACSASRTRTRAARFESVEQIERLLRWLGIEWDGETTFQLDRLSRAQDEARGLVEEGSACEDEGAIRIHMPDEGLTGWDDAIKGRIEFPSVELEDLVLVRSDGRPTYNFASPLEDWLDGITHVIRGDDHVSNTPKQIHILRALGAELPTYAHVPNVFGPDGRKLSKRHGAVSVDEFRDAGYVPEALMNFLALLGWAPDGETTIMSATSSSSGSRSSASDRARRRSTTPSSTG